MSLPSRYTLPESPAVVALTHESYRELFETNVKDYLMFEAQQIAEGIPPSDDRDKAHLAIAKAFAELDDQVNVGESVSKISDPRLKVDALASSAVTMQSLSHWQQAYSTAQSIKDRVTKAEAYAIIGQRGDPSAYVQARRALRMEFVFNGFFANGLSDIGSDISVRRAEAFLTLGEHGDKESWKKGLDLYEQLSEEERGGVAIRHAIKGYPSLLDKMMAGDDRPVTSWEHDPGELEQCARIYLRRNNLQTTTTLLHLADPAIGLLGVGLKVRQQAKLAEAEAPYNIPKFVKKQGLAGIKAEISRLGNQKDTYLHRKSSSRLVEGIAGIIGNSEVVDILQADYQKEPDADVARNTKIRTAIGRALRPRRNRTI